MRTFDCDVFNADFKLQTPVSMLISGSSGAGKTHFIESLIQNNKFDIQPKIIYYFYPEELGNIPVKERLTMFTFLISSFNNIININR